MLATADLDHDDIAGRIGVTRMTLWNWRQAPEFRDEINRLTAEAAERILARGIALREKRVEYQNERHAKMRQVIAERAVDPSVQDVPGGTTGLLVRQIKQVGAGRDAQIIEEYAVDTGLLREIREHEKMTAQEVGQWTEKREVTGKGGGPIEYRLGAPDPAIEAAERAYLDTLGTKSDPLGG